MNFKVIRWLDSYLRPSMDVFEYGAGGSTPFVARRVHRLISVEHDPRWFTVVSDVLAVEGIRNCALRLVPAVKSERATTVPYGPRSYTSFAPHTKGYTFEAYVRTIEDYADGAFDLVIVDGYARPSAVAHAIPKIRPGGYLLLDDSDGEYVRPAIPVLDGFPRRDFLALAPFERGLQQASVWRIDAKGSSTPRPQRR